MSGFEREEIERLIDAAARYGLTFVSINEPDRELEISLPRTRLLRATTVEPAAVEPQPGEETAYVRSTLVGFFRATNPDLAPESAVAEDTVVGVIEALGLPNELRAGRRGVFEDLLAKDGQPVEYGQAIARIRRQ